LRSNPGPLDPLPRDGFWTEGGAPEPGEPARRPQAGSRTRFESRVLFRNSAEDAEEIATPTRTFSLVDITSGLPDDSREADERAAPRQLREQRARVKAARAMVAITPGLAETFARDWRKAAPFYARFGIMEGIFRRGVPSTDDVNPDATERLGSSCDWAEEVTARESMVLPGSDAL